jgi:glycosyltransferase involved in cell wall biosynthesis
MISIIIPTYNCAAYLDECLESVFQQTRKEFEVIVVDDGSTDETQSVLGRWQERIRCITLRKNGGIANARNTALGTASGEFIALLDADDIWSPKKLEKQMKVLEQSPAAGLVCSDFAIDETSGALTPSFFARSGGYATGKVFPYLVRNCFVFTSTVILRRSILQRTGNFDTALAFDDYGMWLKVAHHADVAVASEVLVTKRERLSLPRVYPTSATNQIAALLFIRRHIPDLSAMEVAAIQEQLTTLQRGLGHYLLVNGRAREARAQLFASGSEWSPSKAGLVALTYMPQAVVQAARRMRRCFLRPAAGL